MIQGKYGTYWFKSSDGTVTGMTGYGWENALANLRYCLPKATFVSHCSETGVDITTF